MKNNLRKISFADHWIKFLIALFLVFVSGIAYFIFQKNFSSPRELALYLQTMGPIAPFVFIIFEIIEVVAAPIPGIFLSIAAGYTFGPIQGAIYSYIGNTIGTIIAFLLARKFGRPLVEKLVDQKKLNRYDCLFKQHGKTLLWIAFFIPLFPADLLSFIAGLSKLAFKSFAIIITTAYIPYIITITYFGASLYDLSFERKILFGGILIFLFAIAYPIAYLYLKSRKKDCA